MAHRKHSWLMHILLPGTILTDAHSDKKEIKMANQLAEKQQKEADHHAEILAEVAAGGMPDLNGSKAGKIMGEAAPIVGSVAGMFGNIFGGGMFGGKKKGPDMGLIVVISAGVLLLLVLLFKKK